MNASDAAFDRYEQALGCEGRDPAIVALAGAVDSCDDVTTKAMLEGELRAARSARCDKELYRRALSSAVGEVRAIAPQLQLLNAFDDKDQSEPLVEISHLLNTVTARGKIKTLSSGDKDFLRCLLFRLIASPSVRLSSNYDVVCSYNVSLFRIMAEVFDR
ncbi:MAG: hypothetical protein LBF24_01980 [Puniceicoccales bacterium]|jgi:hypothetical protein|nr:hypothetical protein [Puniceicoccales bacterium]